MLINSIRPLSQSVNKFFYLTTPIFYVNAVPHIGHLYSGVISDCIVRYQQLKNPHRTFLFSTGTDEHGTKVQQAAKSNSQSLNEYCTNISEKYKTLFGHSNIQYTHYNRTSDREKHFVAVQHLWNVLESKNHFYKTKYSGWYCVSDETYLTDSQIKDEKGVKVSMESGHPVQWMEEENYMFKLSQFQNDVIYWVKQGNRIKPEKFEKILLGLLNEPLPDISVSRPVHRVHWGINVPNDESQTIYVWLDALVNYLTSAGYPDESFKCNWPPNVQVIGKDILKFHGIYWPAFLIAAGLEPPSQLLVHSHWTVDDTKMSKSKKNVVDPNVVSQKYTYEGLRYFLLREGVPHSDGNYSDEKAIRILNAELADTLGNLLSRGCAKVINEKQTVPPLNADAFQQLLQNDITKKLVDQLQALPDECAHHFDSYNFHFVVDNVFKVLHTANAFVSEFQPWELRKHPHEIKKLESVLRIIFESLRVCGIILQPVIPDMSAKILNKINVAVDKRNWSDTRIDFEQIEKNEAHRNLGPGDAILFMRIR